jgi:hypothetical protein
MHGYSRLQRKRFFRYSSSYQHQEGKRTVHGVVSPVSLRQTGIGLYRLTLHNNAMSVQAFPVRLFLNYWIHPTN